MISEDPLFDLFDFDSPQFLAWAAPSAVDPHAYLIPPIFGGAPAWYDDLWDFLQDIWGLPGDIAEKIGRSFSELFDRIWGWIGGAIRYVWDWIHAAFDWLAGAVSSMLGQVWGWLFDPVGGLWTGIWNRVGDVHEWIGDRVEDAKAFVGWVSDHVWEHKLDPFGWAFRGIAGGFHWVADRVEDRVEDAKAFVGWVSDHLWEHKLDPLGWAFQGIAGGFHWVEDRVGEWAEWSWTTLSGVVTGARDFLNDTLTFMWDHGIKPIMGGVDMVGAAFRELLETIGDKLRDAVMWPLEHIFEPFVDVIDAKLAIPGKLIRGEYEDLGDLMEDVTDPAPVIIAGIAGALILAIFLSVVTALIMSILVEPLTQPHIQTMRTKIGAELLDRRDLSAVRWRELPFDIDGTLAKYGYNEDARGVIAELDQLIPGPSDLVRMAVREAFDPGLAQSLGYVSPAPGDFDLWMARQGYSKEWSDRYWWAHWDLPSVTQGFEMFHRLRGEFTEDDLRQLLRVLDIPPLWHDRFIKIAYRPLTRVDVRRMYALEVLDESGVRDAYLDIGYSPENADRMTEFTKRFSAPDEDGELKEMRDMAQTTIRQGYRRGVISREEAVDYLVLSGYQEDVAEFLLTIDDVALGLRPDLDGDLDVRALSLGIIRSAYQEGLWDRGRASTELEAIGYLPASADLILSLEDLDREREITTLEVSIVRELYQRGAIEEVEAAGKLDDLGISDRQREVLLRRWELDRTIKERDLTVGQLQAAYRQGLIDDVGLQAELETMGYNARSAELLVAITARRLTVSQLQGAVRAGEITGEDFVAQVRERGYSEGDARALLGVTMGRLSLSQLRDGLRRGIFTEAQFSERVVAMGYTPEDSAFLAEITAPPPAPAPSIAQLQEGLRRELVSEDEFVGELRERGYSEEDARYMAGIALRKLSVAQLQKGYKKQLLTPEEFVGALQAIGYGPEDAEYILEISPRKELEEEEELV
jgi:hypothetical protein